MEEELETPEAVENRALEEFEDKTGGGESQQILRDWFARLRKQVDPNTLQYEQIVSEAGHVLHRLRDGIIGVFWLDDIIGNRKRAPRYDIWAWPSEAQIFEWGRRGTGDAGFDDLDQALAQYLKRPWLQHDAIDVSAINALLVMELSALAVGVRSGTALGRPPYWSFILSGGNMFAQFWLVIAGKIIGFFAAWVMLPAIALSLFVYDHKEGAIITIGIWGVYVAYRLIMIPVRWRTRKLREKAAEQVNDRLTAMRKAWRAALGATVNPSRLKEVVAEAERHGAMFPPVLHTLLDRAVKRDPSALVRVRYSSSAW